MDTETIGNRRLGTEKQGQNISLVQLSQNWSNLAEKFSPAAFWFWNAAMTEEEIASTISELAKNKISEILLHPVHGMLIEYLSDEYFDQVRYALSLAPKNGIVVWI
jgi:hypothetical protein